MKRQPRLSRTQVVERLRQYAERSSALTHEALRALDPLVLRSFPLYFASLDAARRAAGVVAASRPAVARSRVRRGRWSLRRVIVELQSLDEVGASTGWAELVGAGRGALLAAAKSYAGGLVRARTLAGVSPPIPQPRVRGWTRDGILRLLRDYAEAGRSLASSEVSARVVGAARWHFGSWAQALEAAKLDGDASRHVRRPYTREDIIAAIRELDRAGVPVRAVALRQKVRLDAVRRLFGSVAAAVQAAGVEAPAAHAHQRWSQARVIEELRRRAARGEVRMSRALERAAQLHFGGAHEARAAAGLPSMTRPPWTRAQLIDELQRRARRGDRGRALRGPCQRLFGSMAEARRVAGIGDGGPRRGVAASARGAEAREGARAAKTRVPGTDRGRRGASASARGAEAREGERVPDARGRAADRGRRGASASARGAEAREAAGTLETRGRTAGRSRRAAGSPARGAGVREAARTPDAVGRSTEARATDRARRAAATSTGRADAREAARTPEARGRTVEPGRRAAASGRADARGAALTRGGEQPVEVVERRLRRPAGTDGARVTEARERATDRDRRGATSSGGAGSARTPKARGRATARDRGSASSGAADGARGTDTPVRTASRAPGDGVAVAGRRPRRG